MKQTVLTLTFPLHTGNEFTVVINMPLLADIISSGYEIPISGNGISFSDALIGGHADQSGIYIIHSNRKVLYIGNTLSTDPRITFGEHLHLQLEKQSAKGKTLRSFLEKYDHPLYCYCISTQDLDMMVDTDSITLSYDRKAVIMKQVLTQLYDPKGNKI